MDKFKKAQAALRRYVLNNKDQVRADLESMRAASTGRYTLEGIETYVNSKHEFQRRVQNGEDVGKVAKDLDITLAQPI